MTALKVEAVCSSKTLVSTYKSTKHYNPEDQHPNNMHPIFVLKKKSENSIQKSNETTQNW
jgi:hypothetical protein